MARDPFVDVDWNSFQDVMKYAKELGPGMSVIKYPTRRNYNIIHTSREKNLLGDFKVLFRTED